MPNDTKQNSNQVNPSNDLPVSPIAPTQDAPSVLTVEDVVPPMPQVGLPKTEEVKQESPTVEAKSEDTTSGSAAPSDDIQTPPVVMGTTPKKKFGNGKVIATILGLFLLVVISTPLAFQVTL